jgi:hypothetical protein
VTGLAGQVSAALVKAGYRAGRVGNTSHLATTVVRYGAGASASGTRIAALFSVVAAPSGSVAAGHVQILLGASATLPPIAASARPRAPSVVIPTSGPQGGTVSAKNGIPCVN